MSNFIEEMEGFSDFETDKPGMDTVTFGGMTAKEMIGNLPTDPHTHKQMKMIFALALDLGYKKDDVKDVYNIDSLGDLTIAEAGDLIDIMLNDNGESREQLVNAQTEKEQMLVWTKTAGISKIGGGFAKCGHCCNFTGDNTLCSGKCLEGILKGKYDGNKVIPMAEDCFKFKHGELEGK